MMGSGQKEDELIKLEIKKCCSDCKTTKTPLWRSGPSGPKSLCNACGIRHRKKRYSPDGNKLRNNNVLKMKVRAKGGRQWGEVERAALLLMALSCGAVFA
ncbi:GATA transcription factor 16 [Henckelia pumila]|uniref:GATA transcription factor 16 n=1 Tax=Henckelia pumila TaxID=405737 RepID=UPI003C6E74AE